MNNVTSQGFIRNLAIMASAGTGKTYQLAMRYILLILKGAKPEDIVAVTFTKKAAGEIFEKIMTLLLELILNREKLQETIRNGFFPENVCRQDLVTVLQKILSCRKKLHIETNDSFLMQSVQSSPAQFGIMGKIAMLDDGDDRPRIKALHIIISSTGSAVSLIYFKATFGVTIGASAKVIQSYFENTSLLNSSKYSCKCGP